MRPRAERPRRETFTAEEMRQLAELRVLVDQAAGSKTKKAAREMWGRISEAQKDLLMRWVAYRLGAGLSR